MDAIERLAREKRYVRVQLAADLRNIPALSFYAGIGYTRTNMGLLKKHL
jgi:ribosomal protein S18 acetylase RimI-like enzyme